MTRIRLAELDHFRGVPGGLTLDCCDRSGKAASLLLIGDNGSGKSTVVDALEFALQGRIGRGGSLNARSVPSALSLRDSSSGRVSITFADGTQVIRAITLTDEGSLDYRGGPHQSFSLSPLVLRRADILQFWATPDEQKQVLFFEYFRTEAGDRAEPPAPAVVKELQESLFAIKQERKRVLAELATRLDPAASAALGDEVDLEQWITNHVYKGVDSDRREALKKKGLPVRIPVVQHKLVWKARELTQRIAEHKKQIKHANKSAKAGAPTPKAAATQRGLAQVGEFVTSSFTSLSKAASFVESITLDLGKLSSVSLSIEVRMKNGRITSPLKVFSEASLDLLAILIYVGIARQAAERGQAKILVLDDVLQSVDGATRVRVLEFLVASLVGWQFVFTVHDRLWAEQVRTVLRRHNHGFADKEIRRWTFDGGPEIVDATSSPTSGIDRALKEGEVYQVCAESGLLLERLSNHLSHSLPISVTRRREDRYTLGDLWPGVLRTLRRTDTRLAAEGVERWVHLRNLLGAHFNEWAQSLSRDEAEEFGQAVRSLTTKVWCSDCESWVDAVRVGASKITGWSCRCGNLYLQPTEAAAATRSSAAT